MKPTETIYVLDSDEYDQWRDSWNITAPNERVQAAMDALLADFDGAACQMDNCSTEGGAPVGWRLTEREGQYGTEWSQRYHYTALVDTGTEVHFACEDCHCALLPRRVPA